MGTILRDLSIAWTLMHCLIMFMFLYESRYSKTKTNIITAVFTVPVLALNMVSILNLGIERAAQLMIFTCVLPSLMFFLIMAKHRDARFLFTFCVVDTIILEILLATNLLDTFLGFGNYIVMFVLRLVISPLMEFVIIKYLRKPYHILQQHTKKGWGIFLVMAALFYAMLILISLYPNIIFDRPEYYPYLVLILILLPVMYTTVFKVLWTQMQLFNASAENSMLNMRIEMINERLLRNAEIENNFKMIRHDLKHKVILLNGYIKNKDFEKALEYINNMIEDIDKNTPNAYCKNNSVNVVLSHYHNIAVSSGIDFKANVTLPEKLTISETDLSVILSNGLENSINALKSCDDKRITVKAFIKDEKLYLEIKNPFSGEIVFDGNMPQSSKENHGYGTKSMATIVKNHGGMYSFVTEDGCFVFRCAI